MINFFRKGFILSMVCCNIFAAEYGSFVYYDRVSGFKNIIYENISGYAIVEGDIIIKKLADAHTPSNSLIDEQAIVLLKVGGGRWPNNEMPYIISEEFSSECQYNILSAMNNWANNTKIKFIELNADDTKHYPGYVKFVPSHTKTNSSYVGFQGGEQAINISAICKKMTIAHELGHALGLWHEQSRADRDSYIQILWDNIEPEHIFNFNQHLNDGEDVGEYDYNSVMHYSEYAFSKNGQKTIIPLVENVEIGQRIRISKKDFAAINYIYPGK